MAWRIEFDRRAGKELSKLDSVVAARILRFLRDWAAAQEDPRAIGEALKGSKSDNLWKYRVGDYRIVASIEDAVLTVIVVRIGNRRDVYRR